MHVGNPLNWYVEVGLGLFDSGCSASTIGEIGVCNSVELDTGRSKRHKEDETVGMRECSTGKRPALSIIPQNNTHTI